MGTKKVLTDNYGLVTITDVMVDLDGTCLTDGINIHDEDGELLAEIAGATLDDVTNGDDAETYIDSYNEEV